MPREISPKAPRKGSVYIVGDFQYRGYRVSQNTDIACPAWPRVTAAQKKAFQQWVQHKKEEIDQRIKERGSKRSTTGPMTLAQAAEEFVEQHLRFTSSFERSEGYRLAKTVAQMGPEIELDELRTNDIASYVALRKSQGIAPGSIKREITNVQTMWQHAIDIWERDVKMIAWKRVKPKIPKRLVKTLSYAEYQRLLACAPTERLKNVIAMAALTGLRWHEVFKVTRASVNLEKRTLTIIGKGNKEAEIPLSRAACSLLSQLWGNKSPKLFDPTNFRREWAATREKAGLQRFNFHHLRHSFATWLDELGCPVQQIQKGLRHSDIDTTLIYTHADMQALSPYLEQLGEKLLPMSETELNRQSN